MKNFIVYVCFLLTIIIGSVFCSETVCEETDFSIVWYIPGFQSESNPTNDTVSILEKCFQGSKTEVIKWKAPPSSNILQTGKNWSDTLYRTVQVSEEVCQKINAMSFEDQQKLILVGHSLGGNIVIKTLARCQNSGVQIKKFIIVGAAMHNDDADIEKAVKAVRETSISVVNPQDKALGYYYRFAEDYPALGTGYAKIVNDKNFKEIIRNDNEIHDAVLYLNWYLKYLQNKKNERDLKNGEISSEIIVPQDLPVWQLQTQDAKIWWDDLDSCKDWQLQINNVSGHCRILNPDKVRMAWGRRGVMEKSFDKVVWQLTGEKRKLKKKENAGNINVIQDFVNAKTETLGGRVCWNDLDSYKDWKLQKNTFTGYCRILDPKNVRRAWGREENLRKSFDNVKEQLNNEK